MGRLLFTFFNAVLLLPGKEKKVVRTFGTDPIRDLRKGGFSHLEMKSCQEMAENKITNNKIQITNKSQT